LSASGALSCSFRPGRAEIADAAPLIAEATRRGLMDDFVCRGIL